MFVLMLEAFQLPLLLYDSCILSWVMFWAVRGIIGMSVFKFDCVFIMGDERKILYGKVLLFIK